MLIVTAKQMEEIEKSALSYDLTMPRLMENAGSAAATLIRHAFPVENINCMVFSGSGNNGGDGIVVARRLYEYGANVILVLAEGEPKTPQAQKMYEFLTLQAVPVMTMEENLEEIKLYAEHSDFLVDALFGIGFHGALSGNSALACEIINQSPATVISLDTPSGISCDHGTVTSGSVIADLTIAFQLYKPLHMLPQSSPYCGKVQLVEIGIPPEVYQNINSKYILLYDDLVWDMIPIRYADAHKGSFGHMLAICGSSPYRGAAVLSAMGGVHTGVGLCTLAAPEIVCSTATHHLPELILQPLPTNSAGSLDFATARPYLERQLESISAVLFGCGSGLEADTERLLHFLLKYVTVPMVLDASALTLLSKNLHLLKEAKAPIVVTPHPGEMATLLDASVDFVQENRVSVALDFAKIYQVTVVLKGYGTVIATPEGKIYLNTTGNSGLARGGSGDLLAGMITSLLAQGLFPEYAASAAVWLHGTAADRCADRLSMSGMLPHDIITDLCQMFLEANR